MNSYAFGREPVPRITLTIAEAAESLGISASSVRRLIKNGSIPTVRLGARIAVPVDALRTTIDRLIAGEEL